MEPRPRSLASGVSDRERPRSRRRRGTSRDQVDLEVGEPRTRLDATQQPIPRFASNYVDPNGPCRQPLAYYSGGLLLVQPMHWPVPVSCPEMWMTTLRSQCNNA